jgi:2-hydroxychromene-2-carboxylate isomerase
VLRGAELRGVRTELAAATARAAARGVRDVPAVVTAAGQVFHGEGELEAAGAAA